MTSRVAAMWRRWRYRCRMCGGTGRLWRVAPSLKCPACAGTGVRERS